MKNQNPKHIQEAIDLLKQSEQSVEPHKKIRYFEEGLDLLDCYLEDSPNIATDQKDRIYNIRMSYTRRLIAQLPGLMNIEILVWFDYIKVLLLKKLPEVEATLGNNPDLKKGYVEFTKLWETELIEALHRLS